MTLERVCTSCNTSKPLTEFGDHNKGKYGKRSICKDCKRASSREYRERNKDKVNKASRERRHKKDKVSQRATYIKLTYGLTIDEYAEMYKNANESCEICGKHLQFVISDGYTQSDVANIDHCHDTGLVRGILCGDCNRGLGLFKDSVSKLKSATKYLERFKDE